MTRIRLNKFLSEQGVCSRRAADVQIGQGKVKINGIPAKLGDFVDTNIDKVQIDGELINSSKIKLSYYAFYKPRGVITTKDDELGRKSVMDYVPKGIFLNPIGRLDMESEGLILLTNDGELVQNLTHPKFEHEKEYYIEAHMSSGFDLKNLGRLEQGLKISGIRMKAKKVSKVMIEKKRNLVKFNMILTTGYNRQIRRMCDKIGLSVQTIHRIRVGKLVLESLKLKPGELRAVRKDQII